MWARLVGGAQCIVWLPTVVPVQERADCWVGRAWMLRVCVCLMECAGAACGLHLPVRWNATVVSHMLESPLLHRITSGTHCNTQQEHHHHTTTLCELTAHRVFRVWEQECACPSSRVPVAVLVGLLLTWTHHHRAVATPEGFWEHYVLRMAVEHSWRK